MHTVYLELFLIDNVLINYYILYLSGRVLKVKMNVWLGFLSALIGAVYGIFSMLGYQVFNIFFIKVLLSLLMVYLSYINSRKIYFKLLMSFYGISFLFGGLILFLMLSDSAGIIGKAIALPLPLRFALLILIVGHFSFSALVRVINSLKYNKEDVSLTISYKEKSIECVPYFDTGNNCTYFNSSVIFVNKNLIGKIIDLNELNSNNSTVLAHINIVYIPYKVANGETKISLGIKAHGKAFKVTIKKNQENSVKEIKCYLALSDDDFNGQNVLAHPNILD